MNKNLRRHLAALGAGIVMSGNVAAASISFYMDQSNTLPDGVNYLQVTIDDALAPGNINFTVTPLSSLTDIAGSNFGIQEFAFNGDGLSSANILFTDDAVGWKFSGGVNFSEFGVFDNLAKGTGSSRANPLTFSITGVNGDTINSYASALSDGTAFFAAHVAGFSFGCGGSGRCITSAKFAGDEDGTVPPSSVPAPTAAWLFASGLIGMAAVSRRNRAK